MKDWGRRIPQTPISKLIQIEWGEKGKAKGILVLS